MKKRMIALLLVMAVALAGLSACGGAAASATTPAQSTAAPSQAGSVSQPAASTPASSTPASSASNNTDGVSAFEQANADLEAALAPLPETGTGINVGAIESTLANSFWITMQEGYEDAAAEWGVTVDVMATDSETDMQGQLDIMNDMLVKDYSAIAVSPLTEQNMIPGIVQANQAGVAVVAVGNGVDEDALAAAGGSIAAFITSDFKAQGALGAEFVIEKVGGSGKVAVIEGIPGATQSDSRRDGAVEAFEAAGMDLLPVQTGNFDRQTAYDLMSAMLDANPDLVGVTCGNDVMALGVVEALKDKNMLEQVTVVGVDFIEEAKASIEAGELDATVAMSPYLFGKAGLLCALKAVEGHAFEEAVIWTPLSLVNADNVAAMEGWK